MRNCFALDLCLVATTLVSAAELKEVASFPINKSRESVFRRIPVAYSCFFLVG